MIIAFNKRMDNTLTTYKMLFYSSTSIYNGVIPLNLIKRLYFNQFSGTDLLLDAMLKTTIELY